MKKRVQIRNPDSTLRLPPAAGKFLLAVVVIACLAWTKVVMVPIAFAVLLAFIFNPVVMLLTKRGLPRAPAVLTVVAATGVLVGSCWWVLGSQVLQFASQLPEYEGNVTRRINELRSTGRHSVLTRIEEFGNKVATAVSESAETPASDGTKNPPKKSDQPQAVRIVNQEPTMQFGPIAAGLDAVFEFLASVALVVVLVVYMLINREQLRNRFLWLFGEGHMTLTTRALDDAAQGLSRFLLMQLLINGAFGLFVGLGLWLIGMPYPLLWGVLSTFLRYIPFVGPWIAMLFPFALSLAVMPGWTKPALIVGLYVAYELVANLALEPLLYGQSMGVSPAALLVAIAFWSWLWGAPGLVLSVPLTVCLVVLGKHVPSLTFLDILLGDEAVLTPDVQFYQRLLARDEDEAFDIVRDRLQQVPLGRVFDEIVIPALSSSRSDFESGLISENEAAAIFEIVRETVEELESAPTDPPEATAAQPAVPRSKIKVLACAARDAADEAAVEMLSRLVDPRIGAIEVISTDHLVSEIISKVAEEHPAIVVIGSLPPGGLAHTRLLCKRLRSGFPDLKIVVGRWGLKADAELKNREQLIDAGADNFARTLEETATQLVQLQQMIQSIETPAGTLRPVATVAQTAAEKATTDKAAVTST
ncbi:MAG TPA: AI-2E family transporter [Planctomycetaceae bacterium]|nr:AI-2E family transporter [Planctomycetaceae bacterium]